MSKQMLLMPYLIADVREPKYIIEKLKEQTHVTVMQLNLGDYIIKDIAIERKNVEDFESSIIDGRLFKQAFELKEHYKNVIFILEGNPERLLRLDKKIFFSAISKLAKEGITLINTNSQDDTVIFLFSLAKKLEEEEESFTYIVKEKKPLSIEEQKVLLLSSIRRIGKKRAKVLLEHFKTIKNIANANVEQLKNIETIGKKRAEQIFNIFNK
jgi:Fanconi anemia group M protein